MKNFVFIIITLFAVANTVSAKEIFIIGTQGKGVSESDLEVVTELIESSVTNLGGYTIGDNRWKANLALRPKLLKLGNSFILSITSYKGKEQVGNKKMKAKSIEEMDKVVSRVVKALLTSQTVESAAQVDDVTQEEVEQSSRRYQSLKQWSIGLGAGWAKGLEYSKTGTTFMMGYNFGLDPVFDLAVGGEILFATGSEDVTFNNFSIDLSYFFSKNKVAPFVLGGFGYGFASAEDVNSNTLIGSNDNADGFTLKLGGGIKFFRTSTVNLGLLVTHTHMFSKTKDSNENPGVTSLRLVVFY